MSNVPKCKRKKSGFEVVDLAADIYNDLLYMCLRMPNRYTYLILQPILNLAGDLADNTRRANSIIPNEKNPNKTDVMLRRQYFIAARSSLFALIGRLNFFMNNPDALRHKLNGKEIGMTADELDSLAAKIDRETDLVQGILNRDLNRFGDGKK